MTTNLSVSNSEPLSSSFYLLDKRIQRWIWDSGWDELKDIQEQSIPLILEGKKDVVLAAATASGKTEAAFLPILTRMLQEPEIGCVLYISPLKALINDQFGRLEQLCEKLEIPVTPWHGDIGATKKKKFLQSQKGVVLITPESLEAMLILRGHDVPNIFKNLRYIVIDELHAFIGSERGKQLQSLMHRIDIAIKRATPRIALSATLGDMEKAGEFLRPKSPVMAEIIESKSDERELKILIKGYEECHELNDENLDLFSAESEKGYEECYELDDENLDLFFAESEISEHLFQKLRGSNNLIFPNSRQEVEFFADSLRQKSEDYGVDNEFFPHYGNLSKTIREEAEARLKSSTPVSVICTSTLELGIDIGGIKNVAQIGAPYSVASLRQRVGRSGRRKGEVGILWVYIAERAIGSESRLSDLLRENLVQVVAQVCLLLKGWYEAPRIQNLHLSTLIQQLLSLIAQYGGISAADAWQILCGAGLFGNVNKQDFMLLLRQLGEEDTLIQTPDGLLLHGVAGEKIVNDYKFYAAFKDAPEYRVIHGAKELGKIEESLSPEAKYLIFVGQRWEICNFDVQKKRIEVIPAPTGKIPIFDGNGNFFVDDKVRQEMYQILVETAPIPFLDKTAAKLLDEARSEFRRLKFGDKSQTILNCGKDSLLLFTWRGSRVTRTICRMLAIHGVQAHGDLYIEIKTSSQNLFHIFGKLVTSPPDGLTLVIDLKSKQQEKWDCLLPEPLLSKNYTSAMLDIDGAIDTIRELLELYD